ncbi:peptidoglycan DD-metalloendopeptidase family protein [Silanimonas sp.]|uniref:M23 family metallopeptidase n=1 Tax=Silanimonas sp. TaxID=1929290 RepID=UPI0037CA0AB1
MSNARRLAPKAPRALPIALAGALAVLLGSIVPALDGAMEREAQPESVTQAIALPPPPAATAASTPRNDWQTVRIASGQTLGSVFADLGLPASTMHRVLEVPEASQMATRLRVGSELAFEIGADGQLKGLRFDQDESKRVQLAVSENAIEREVIERPMERRVVIAGGTIRSSLFADGAKAGLSAAVMNDMVKALQYDIDFAQDLREGDAFQIVYEELWREGERLRDGGVVAVNFINQGKPYTAVRFEHNGQSEFFDLDGRPLRKSFMRTPIEFARLSSGFGARRHPILGRMRMHKGVDYAAPTGTPIFAAGDARVKFAGWQNGYGRTVILDHGNGITTLYAHMSRLGSYRVGQRVQQGRTIGYVGTSGLSSGPHLHYEFRVNGAHRNPLTVTMPKPEPLTGAALAEYRRATAPALAQLKRIEGFQLAAR